MGSSQRVEKMRHSSEQCTGLSVSTGRGNRAQGCWKQRGIVTYVYSQLGRDKATRETRLLERQPILQSPLTISAKAVLCLVTGRPPQASTWCPNGVGDMLVSWHVSQNHRGSAGGRAAFPVWLAISWYQLLTASPSSGSSWDAPAACLPTQGHSSWQASASCQEGPEAHWISKVLTFSPWMQSPENTPDQKVGSQFKGTKFTF